MITERTLRNWRRDALSHPPEIHITTQNGHEVNIETLRLNEMNQRILRLTQELIDLHLVRKI